MSARAPDLDHWLPDATVRVIHRRTSTAGAEALWEAACRVRLNETGLLGRLVRWRIPGLAREETFDALFREPPFTVLESREHALVCGLVGRIWTLRRDYPTLGSPDEFRDFSRSGSAKVVLASWVEPDGDSGASLTSEARVGALGAQGRIGVAAVRPIVRTFHNLVGSEGITAAVRRAERAD